MHWHDRKPFRRAELQRELRLSSRRLICLEARCPPPGLERPALIRPLAHNPDPPKAGGKARPQRDRLLAIQVMSFGSEDQQVVNSGKNWPVAFWGFCNTCLPLANDTHKQNEKAAMRRPVGFEIEPILNVRPFVAAARKPIGAIG
jgi:hypothetical protein